jgi:cobalt/nickel transport system permease protein
MAVGETSGWARTRSLWVGLAVLMVLSPIGLLAAGTAWGEWAPKDFANPAARIEIQAGSGGVTVPAHPPAGMERLASFWTAPIPDYAPAFLKSEAFGYILSAVFGVGLILLVCLLIGWLLRPRDRNTAAPTSGAASS